MSEAPPSVAWGGSVYSEGAAEEEELGMSEAAAWLSPEEGVA